MTMSYPAHGSPQVRPKASLSSTSRVNSRNRQSAAYWSAGDMLAIDEVPVNADATTAWSPACIRVFASCGRPVKQAAIRPTKVFFSASPGSGQCPSDLYTLNAYPSTVRVGSQAPSSRFDVDGYVTEAFGAAAVPVAVPREAPPYETLPDSELPPHPHPDDAGFALAVLPPQPHPPEGAEPDEHPHPLLIAVCLRAVAGRRWVSS